MPNIIWNLFLFLFFFFIYFYLLASLMSKLESTCFSSNNCIYNITSNKHKTVFSINNDMKAMFSCWYKIIMQIESLQSSSCCWVCVFCCCSFCLLQLIFKWINQYPDAIELDGNNQLLNLILMKLTICRAIEIRFCFFFCFVFCSLFYEYPTFSIVWHQSMTSTFPIC